ncbi:hypothetical protein Q7P37_011505 [Cladosporium fusiforme]
MSEAQHMSLPDAGDFATDVDYKLCTSNIARRSISIFSRRGTETPEAATTSFEQPTMSRSPTKKMSERQQTWLRRRTLEVRGSKDLPKATILKAVPPAERLRMTQLEQEMATSPNEEIVSAISEHNTTQPMWAALSDHNTQSPQSPSTPIQSHADWQQDPMHRTDSAKRRETNTRIGIWVNGVTHWDKHPTETAPSPISRAAGSVRSTLQDTLYHRSAKPALTVSIPYTESLVHAMPDSATVLPGPQSFITPQRPKDTEADNHATPRITVVEDNSTAVHPNIADESSNLPEKLASALQPDVRRSSSSTSSSTINHSDGSIYSKRSSTTSVDPVQSEHGLQRRRQQSQVVCSEVFDAQCSSSDEAASSGADTNKPLPRVPVPSNMRAAPAPPSSPVSNTRLLNTRSTSAPGSRRIDRVVPATRLPTSGVRSHSLCDLDVIDAEFMRASPYMPSMSDRFSEAESPTLSQAEHDLHAQLSTISEIVKDDEPASNTLFYGRLEQQAGLAVTENGSDAHLTNHTALHRSDSVRSVMQPPARAPTLPKRSRKREWRNSYQVENTSPQAIRLPPKAPGRRKSESALTASAAVKQQQYPVEDKAVHRSESAKVPNGSRSYDRRRSVVYQPSSQISEPATTLLPTTLENQPAGYQTNASHDLPAERVLLQILGTLASTKDLFSMSVINKGMYRVFKENELHLIRTVALNQSPAGWELREWRPPGSDETSDQNSKISSQLEHTPQSYMCSQRIDENVIEGLKKLVLDHCQTFVRREAALSFAHPCHPDAQRFTDAFWRIWTFCVIFGSDKGREEDVTGQLDWLKGGLLANNQSFSATVNTNLDFDMGSVLLNAPEHFAQGNKGGLSAAQLYDVTELWNCLGALLAGYHNHVEEARRCGIFVNCEVRDGDIELEEHMLEEWIAYVMTLGPQVVLELAKHAINDPAAGFALAEAKGWADWTPSVTGSRATFLREPVARLYEERVSTAAMRMQDPQELEKKETARKRVAALAAEIKLRRQSTAYKRLPMIDMHSERAMSMVSRHSSVIPSRQPPHMLQTTNLPPAAIYHAYSTRSSRPPPRRPSSTNSIVSPLSHHTPTAASARPSSPEQWPLPSSVRQISPIIEDRVEAFNRLSLANLDGVADSTVERAVRKITEMGFTETQAKRALRMTDMGDGLRVDRAVDMLLRN